MPRYARRKLNGEYYHIVVQGLKKEFIFAIMFVGSDIDGYAYFSFIFNYHINMYNYCFLYLYI